MEEEKKQRQLLSADYLYSLNTLIIPTTYEEYVLELYAEGRVNLAKAADLISGYEVKYLAGL